MTMKYIKNIPPDEYAAFMARREDINFLQSPEWGALHQALGDVIVCGGIERDGTLVAAWTAIVKNARRGRYLEVPGGPVINWRDTECAQYAITMLKREAKQHGCVFIRIRPQLYDADNHRQILRRYGLRLAPMHLHAEHTNIIDLSPSEDELLANMRRQTRYEVRRVAKRGVTITAKQPTTKDIHQFYAMQHTTAQRHGFIQSSESFLQALAQAFCDHATIYSATKDGIILNQALVIHWGNESDYYEAASAIEARKEPGAYGIIWRAMQDAKKRGSTRFNLWGIAYNNNPNHRYAGVTTFKRGFGGDDVTYIPAHDVIIRPVRYALTWIIETVRRKRRGL